MKIISMYCAIFIILSVSQPQARQATLRQSSFYKTGMPEPGLKSHLLENVLAFPQFSRDYLNRIYIDSGFISVWSEKKIKAYAVSRGLSVNSDSKKYGSESLHRAAVFTAPGLSFSMRAAANERGDFSPYGWWLVLDMALLKSNKQKNNNYNNYTIFIDGVQQKRIIVGFSSKQQSPIKIPIAFIRNSEGRVKVEIRLNNNPSAFGFLYDAVLNKSHND